MQSQAVDRPAYVVPPQVVGIATLVLIVLVDRLAPLPFLPQAAALVAGGPLLVTGIGLWVWGGLSFRHTGESPEPGSTGRVLTSGAFRVSRNPIYAGGTLAMLGLGVLLNTLLGVGVAVASGVAAHFLAIMPEERYLEAKFGEAYRAYRGQVRRWL